MGMNRSATTAAIFMALHGFAPSFEEALRIQQRSRGVVSPMRVYRTMGSAFVAAARAQQEAKAQARRAALAAAAAAGSASSNTGLMPPTAAVTSLALDPAA